MPAEIQKGVTSYTLALNMPITSTSSIYET